MNKTIASQPLTGYQKMVIAMLALLQFTVVLDFMIISPLGFLLMKVPGINTTRFGLIVSSYAISACISSIVAAGFVDKYDRKKVLLFFYAGFILGTLCCALSNSFWTLLAARIVTGLFGGVIGAISMSIITDLFELNQRGKVMGFVQMGFAASQVLGIPIGLFFAPRWGWQSAFMMIVVLAGLIIGLILLNLKPIDKHLAVQTDKNPFLHLYHTLTNKKYRAAYIAVTFLPVGGYMLMPFGSAFSINNLHIHQEQLQWLYLVSGLSSVVIMPLVGRLSDKYDKYKVFFTGSVIAIIMVNIYVNLPVVSLVTLMIVNVFLFMGIMSRIVPATTLNSAIPDMADRGAFMSVCAALQQMAGGIGAFAAGLIVHQKTSSSPLENYHILGIVVSAFTVICLFLVYQVSLVVKAKLSHIQKPIVVPQVEMAE